MNNSSKEILRKGLSVSAAAVAAGALAVTASEARTPSAQPQNEQLQLANDQNFQAHVDKNPKIATIIDGGKVKITKP